jgi:predicted dehydrogenase
MKKLRIGFLSTANIGRKNWKAIFNSGNSIVTAVASRDLARSRKFISECQRDVPFENLPEAFGDYDELLASKNVDAVYIPLPTALRKEFVIRAAENGKHVICEKPCAPNEKDLREMIAACKKNSVQFMDGVMFMHSRRLEKIRAALDGKTSVGQVKRIATQFSFVAPPEFFRDNIRADKKLEPLGCVGDLGWYCIRFILWTMNWQMPRRIAGKILSRAKKNSGVPVEFSAELFFTGGISASFYCSFLTSGHQFASVGGAEGCLYVSDFVVPFPGSELTFETRKERLGQRGCEFVMKPDVKTFSVAEFSNSHASAQESNMFRNFANQIFSGKLNADWPMWSLKTQKTVDACLESARNGCAVKL